jgi:L-lactate dehydrogenase complex protein LldG
MSERAGEALFELFKAKATGVSAEVHRFKERSEAVGFVTGFLAAEGVSSKAGSWAVWAEKGLLSEAEKAGVEVKVPGVRFDVTRERSAEALVGISAVDGGMADTGSLFQDATAPDLRLVSTLPPIRVAFLDTGRIVPDLATALGTIDPAASPYLAFITGPSRTADIERVLTIGVHGPGRLVVVCYDKNDAVEA